MEMKDQAVSVDGGLSFKDKEPQRTTFF